MSDESTQIPERVDPSHITRAASDSLNVRRVFGEAYEQDGSLVIPVAKVFGGTGSGWGWGEGEAAGASDQERNGSGGGGGGGFGVRVKPLGVYVVDESGTRWQPVLDLNRVILGGQLVGVAVALITGWALGRRRRS